MTSHEFILKLNRQVTADEAETLYASGCDDGAIETGSLGTLIHFDREARSLAEAISTAARDVEVVPGLHPIGVACENMVTLTDIATHAGVSHEAARLWSAGLRGPGNFPPPVLITSGGEKVWDWEEVAEWLTEHKAQHLHYATRSWKEAAAEQRVLSTADRVLAARHALMSEPDGAVREEFERLLQDA